MLPVRTVCRACGQPFAGAACPHCGTVPLTITPSAVDRSLVEPQVLAPPRRADEIGRLGPYRILALLGEGGMGRVYRAEDPALQREVAIKLMLPQQAANPLAKKRFVREARAQAKVEHDHVVPIFQVAEVNGVPFLAMPLLRGMSLAQALSGGGRPPVTEACRIAREAADGLTAAHEQGLIHRDIKPGNIWLEGSRRRVKILDFGLARVAAEADTDIDRAGPHDEPVADHLTRTGALIGTPAYMPPEQARGEPVDHRADLYSLGVVLYQMLAGRRPFEGTMAQVLAALATVTPKPPSAFAPGVPAALDALVMRLLAKNPADRPASADRLVEELKLLELGLSSSDAVRALPLGFAAQPVVDPWATLDTTFGNRSATSVRLDPSGGDKPRRSLARLWFVAAAWVAAAAIVAGVVLLRPSPVPTRPAPTEPVKPPVVLKPTDSPDRAAAKWALGLGAKVTLDDTSEPPNEKFLPTKPFAVTAVNFFGTGLAPIKDLKPLADLTRLESLDFRSTGHIAQTGLSAVRSKKSLRWLSLFENTVSDETAADIGTLTGLTFLQVQRTGLTNAGLAEVAKLTRLRTLQVGDNPLTDIGVAKLVALTELDELALNGVGGLEGDCLPALAKLPRLKSLSLHWTGVRATAFDGVRFPALESLSLQRTAADDRTLLALADTPTLLKLELHETKVTAASVKAFAAKRPGCRIEWAGGVIEPTARP